LCFALRAQVLHALDEPLPVVRYNTWHCHLPEGSFLTEIGNDQFSEVLARYHGAEAVRCTVRCHDTLSKTLVPMLTRC
jgi:hypothetical protein